MTAAPFDHRRHHRIEQIHHAEDVDADHLLGVGDVELRRVRGHADAGVGDGEIEHAARFANCVLYGHVIRYIALDRDRVGQFAREIAQQIAAPCQQRHRPSAPRQLARQRCANAARRARQDRSLQTRRSVMRKIAHFATRRRLMMMKSAIMISDATS